jgi:RimJ/RimL family protein N-acetyltransferase
MKSEGIHPANAADTDTAALLSVNAQYNHLAPQNGVHTMFADSALWQMQRHYYEQRGLSAWADGQVPHYVTNNPFFAKAYAEIVLGFWRDLKAQGFTGQPLYIIELGAGCGRFAYHFLLEFFSAFDAIRGPEDKACYVMTDFSTSTVAQWNDPLFSKLKPFVAQGRLDFAVFDAEVDSQIHLQHQNIILARNSLALPPVVIANYVFSSLRQDLFYLAKDRIFEGWLALNPREQAKEFSADHPFSTVQLDYQKRRVSEPGYANPQWNYLIESYTKRLPPCALLFPSYALDTLERLSKLHNGKLLLLSGDRSTHELNDLATQQEPDISFHSSFSLPVNYHALMHLIQHQGGQCWINAQNDGLAIFVACVQTAGQDSKTPNTYRETSFAVKQSLQGFNPSDFYRIKQTLETEAEYLSPEQMLAFLRLSHWDTKIFYLMFAYIYDDLAQLPAQQQNEWYLGLAEVWRYHLPIGEDYDLAYDLALLAAELNRWQSAIYLFSQSLEKSNQAQSQSSVYFNLGIAHWQMASLNKAESYLVKALALAESEAEPASESTEQIQTFDEHASEEITNEEIEDDDFDNSEDDESDDDEQDEDYEEDEEQNSAESQAPTISEQLTELRAWQAQCQKILGAQVLQLPATTPANPKALYASLLGPHQALALYRLQRDPELAKLAGVECLRSSEHAREWIQQEQSDSKHVLAILHPDFGLIGVAALECPTQALQPGGSRSGRFYYWIGEEFQWQGYGSQAMRLLHQLASKIGVLHIFSTVDKTNIASQRALAKLGYQRLPFDIIGERPGYRYHHFGLALSEAELHPVLAQLLAELNTGISLAPLTQAQPKPQLQEQEQS